MIPLLAYIIVQSHVPRIASLIYYMQHYRLARMVEGSVYSFVITTMKSAVEFLKDDPLSLNDLILSSSSSTLSLQHSRTRSTSFGSNNKPHSSSSSPPPPSPRLTLHHRKSQSADLYNFQPPPPFSSSSSSDRRSSSAILRPHMVLPPRENRKSLDIPNDWLLPPRQPRLTRPLSETKPMVSTTFPSLSNSTPLPPIDIIPPDSLLPKLGRSLSASTVVRPNTKSSQQPPKVINIRDRVVMLDGHHQQRPASICLDTRSLHSIEDTEKESEELMGDFLLGLSKIDGDVVGSGTFRK